MKRLHKLILTTTLSLGLIGNSSLIAYASELPDLPTIDLNQKPASYEEENNAIQLLQSSIDDLIAKTEDKPSKSSIKDSVIKKATSAKGKILSTDIGTIKSLSIIGVSCITTVEDMENAITTTDGSTFEILDKAKGIPIEDKSSYVTSKNVVAVTGTDGKVVTYKIAVVIEKKILETEIGEISKNKLIDVPDDTTVSELLDALTLSDGAEAVMLTKSKGTVIEDTENTTITNKMVIKVIGFDNKSVEYKIATVPAEDEDDNGGTTDTQKPTAPTNLKVSNVDSTSATLTWNSSSDNVGVVGYDIYDGTNKVGSTTGETVYNISGLYPSTKYSFSVKARDAIGNISSGATVSFTTTNDNTSGEDKEAPSTPTNLKASDVTSNSANLTWTASIDNVGVVGYDVYRNGILIGTVETTSYTSTGLSANMIYWYYVKAKDLAGNTSNSSNAISITTSSGTTTSKYFPLMSYAPQPDGVAYAKYEYSSTGRTVFYYYDMLKIPSSFISDYVDTLEANGWSYYGSDKTSTGKTIIYFRKGTNLVALSTLGYYVIIYGSPAS